MCFPISYAGFFAKSQIMFFLLSSFRICPPLKNDGRSGLRFGVVLNDFLLMKGKHASLKPSPLDGEGVNRQVDGRGKYEQKGKKVSYKTVANTCLSFLNEVKNLAKNTGVKYVFAVILCRILR